MICIEDAAAAAGPGGYVFEAAVADDVICVEDDVMVEDAAAAACPASSASGFTFEDLPELGMSDVDADEEPPTLIADEFGTAGPALVPGARGYVFEDIDLAAIGGDDESMTIILILILRGW